MSEEDDAPCEECEEGAPLWLATFADLMSLLLCFFVLLLSFSEMDVKKYKQIVGSMKMAFGVQSEVEAERIPMAESVIMKDFRPGRPVPTVLDMIRQQAPEDSRGVPREPVSAEELERLVEQVRSELAEELAAEVLELEVHQGGIMIRVRENDAFPSGSAELQRGFRPVLDKLVTVLNDLEGSVVVSGHTDDVPIRTRRFASNWVLSSARAAAVVHHLAEAGLADPSRIEIRAYADTRPVVANDSRTNRARNRRVEIDVNLDEA